MGVDKMKKHWRNLVARYGAYPVVWCLAGEAAMPYYLAEDKDRARAEQIAGLDRDRPLRARRSIPTTTRSPSTPPSRRATR